ncbi:Ig-like domain-containing protein [Curtobacterium sp. MCLR17_054]|uniref:Ig-like domain-containing protein n=1 Tax=Curtobacterium sp. MCLR17_054 TaxID=2175632 RepID=UPI0011B5882B|nr:Ig-like domain-containing protein [Curtobacterium sp. MCLR17_054]WIE70322.1 Ig-like domain-containing protein [Curtobacterium sp. MCLR17_054]
MTTAKTRARYSRARLILPTPTFFKRVLAAISTVGLVLVLALTHSPVADAAGVSSTPGDPGQKNGLLSIDLSDIKPSQQGQFFTVTAPKGALISRPRTSYPCTRTDTGASLPGDSSIFVSEIKCGYPYSNNQFGTYVYPVQLPAGLSPGDAVGPFRYSIVAAGSAVLDSGTAYVPVGPFARPGHVGQADGEFSVYLGSVAPSVNATFLTVTAPEGSLISRPQTGYSCVRTDTGELLPAGSVNFVREIKCGSDTAGNQFGMFRFPVMVDGVVKPGVELRGLRYVLVDHQGNELRVVNTAFPVAALERPLIEAPTPGMVTNDPTISFRGSAGLLPGVSQSVALTNQRGEVIADTPVVDGQWDTGPLALFDEGSNTVYATARLNGVESEQAVVNFNVDTVPPAAPVVTRPTDGALLNTASPTISGSGDEGDEVTVTDGDKDTICTATVKDSTWSCTPTTVFADGTYTMMATAADAAGNTADSAPVRFTVSTVPTITSPADGSLVLPVLSAVSGTVPGQSSVRVFDTTDGDVDASDSTLLGLADPDGDGKWSVPLTARLKVGERVFVACAPNDSCDAVHVTVVEHGPSSSVTITGKVQLVPSGSDLHQHTRQRQQRGAR